MTTKVCTKCGEEKPATTEYFYVNRAVSCGLGARCKPCAREYTNERRDPEKDRAYYLKNRERYKQQSTEWRKNNREKMREIVRKSAARPEAKARRAKWKRERLRSDPRAWLADRCRKRLKEVLCLQGKGDAVTKLREYLGCSVETLKEHLESHFTVGMSWENRGPRGWHLDHFMPLLGEVNGEFLFDFSLDDELKVAGHFKNLRPLWGTDNVKKSNAAPHWDDIPKDLQDICTPRIKELLQKVEKTS